MKKGTHLKDPTGRIKAELEVACCLGPAPIRCHEIAHDTGLPFHVVVAILKMLAAEGLIANPGYVARFPASYRRKLEHYWSATRQNGDPDIRFRTCLHCGNRFWSLGPGNRQCLECRWWGQERQSTIIQGVDRTVRLSICDCSGSEN